jgi:hypothetical protein
VFYDKNLDFGGAREIRTPGAARAYLGGIRPEFGALFGPNKSIRAGENLFAWGSALLRISLFPFVRQADARNPVTSNNENQVSRRFTRRPLRSRPVGMNSQARQNSHDPVRLAEIAPFDAVNRKHA